MEHLTEKHFNYSIGDKTWRCLLQSGRYKNGRLALELIDWEDLNPIVKITVNIPSQTIADDEIIVSADHPELPLWLERHHIATLTEITIWSDFDVFPVMKLTPEYKRRFLL